MIEHQEGEISELRQRLGMLTSKLQFFEAKMARVETSIAGGAPPPSSRAPASIRIDEESSDFTLNVPRADVDAVVSNVMSEAPYPIAMPGSSRAHTDGTGVPFHPADDHTEETLSSPGVGGVLPSPSAAIPFSTPAEPRARKRKVESFVDEASYDDSLMTSVLKRRPSGDGG